ncbi:MAG TPA: SCO family protein [Candidatus Pelagibacter bacterium]|jgi:protein SCO1/2|nr:SCO family protein [Candidatus Pelagibacter bacterium]|tara:strand:+ start:1274 stop:1858 length:585 start_codon:yes stop_codon:yes gene_type:complete
MKLKTSLTIIAGCFGIFLFIMLPIFLSIQSDKEKNIISFKGSKFSLKDMNNNVITDESFQGPLTAIFFGFTNCPDICPMTLNKMDIVLNKLKKENKSLKLFFISVDPERDTSEVVKDYLNSFESNFIGITGKPEKIYLLSQSWGIFSQKIFKDDGKYNVDHSSPVILLKDGKYVARISHKDDIKKSIKIIKKYL